MNAVQLNTRVSAELRERGAKSFNNAGVNLSEAIRIYLDFASRNLNSPKKVEEALNVMREDKKNVERQRKLKLAKEGPKILETFCKDQGIKLKPNLKTDNMTYKELRDYYWELDHKKVGA